MGRTGIIVGTHNHLPLGRSEASAEQLYQEIGAKWPKGAYAAAAAAVRTRSTVSALTRGEPRSASEMVVRDKPSDRASVRRVGECIVGLSEFSPVVKKSNLFQPENNQP